jgi:flagellar motor switch protein FliM
MAKVLDQEQIDALVRAARQGPGASDSSAGPVVQLWDVRQARRIGREQLHSINQLHEVFARNLGHSLAAYLRTTFECSLVSAEHLTYSEFLASIPAVTYLASCDLAPVGVIALLQIDIAIAFSMIDLLLGGEGKGAPPGREVTQIEEQILESIARIICRELQNTWQAVSLEFNFGQRQPTAQANRLMPPEEKNLCLSFEVKIADARGTLNLAVPAVASNALLRKILVDYSYRRPRTVAEARHQIQRKLQRCAFPVELSVAGLQIPARALVDLKPGTLLRFALNVGSPATLLVEEIPLATALPARVNSRRAAQVLNLESPTSPEGEK